MVKIEQTGGRLTEEEILHGKEDAYGIYQVNRKGAGRDYAFLSFDSLRSKGKVPERTEYQLVYSDILGADENRDSLFTKFNIAHPDDFPEENLYPGKCSLFEGGEICREFLDIVPFYKENKEVQKAVNYLENHFNKKEKSLMKPKKPEQAPRL